MRVGKRATVVEAKKTRSCLVRLGKAQRSSPMTSPSPPPASRPTRGSAPSGPSGHRVAHSASSSAVKPLRGGPLKKRLIAEANTSMSTPTTTTSSTITPRGREKLKKESLTEPTIAVGRSRRAIKPNPRYASEDIVTPKLLKHGGGGSGDRRSTPLDKHRRSSTSSSEDFYNKASSDEEGGLQAFNDEGADDRHKPYKAEPKDSDFSDMEPDIVTVPKRGRGRPRKDASLAADTSAGRLGSAAPKSSTPSQLQQLRRSLATSVVNRSVQLLPVAGAKRKLDTGRASGGGGGDDSGANKRLKPHHPVEVKREAMPAHKADMGTPKAGGGGAPKTTTVTRIIAPPPNGSKLITLQELQEKRRIFSEKANNKALHIGRKVTSATTAMDRPQKTIMLTEVAGRRVPTIMGKQRSASPATPRPLRDAPPPESKPAAVTPAIATASPKQEGGGGGSTQVPSSTVDYDSDGMPTFTIVNINDIINKKGDALISKASVTGKADSPSSAAASSTASTAVMSESKLSRRKAGHTTILSEKLNTSDGPQARTPAFPPKKPAGAAMILNHTLLHKITDSSAKRSSTTGPAAASEKPVPRILNSVVAKRTLPVKPLIANLEDSAGEGFPLSLDDEDTAPEEPEVSPFPLKRKLASSTPFGGVAGRPPATPVGGATKENSIGATNRLPSKLAAAAPVAVPQRKLSPEKVVISRQGDKIIKKITCFENWYVINMPENNNNSSPARVLRNMLELPLLQLANASEAVQLPSSLWSSKVTLFEMSPAMRAKLSQAGQYTGSLREQNISEEDRANYQPSCVMFRRAVTDRVKSRLPYDRAVIFKNKTFYTNIEGKNVKLEAAPTSIASSNDVEILLDIVDALTLQSDLVEPVTTMP